LETNVFFDFKVRIVLPPWCLHSVGTIQGSKYNMKVIVFFYLVTILLVLKQIELFWVMILLLYQIT